MKCEKGRSRMYTWPLGVSVLGVLGALGAVSCTVDQAGLVFDDDQYNALNGSGGSTSGSGGGSADGGMGGDGVGATSATGGQDGTGGSTCNAGELTCNGRQVQLCAGGEKVDVGAPCEFVCAEGQCTGVCEPSSTQCLSDIEVQICDEAGTWNPSFCQFACVGDQCSGSCRSGENRCGGPDALTVETCDSTGAWQPTATICGGACDLGRCTGTCTNGETQCVDDNGKPAELACSGGSWAGGTVTPCDHVCIEGKCGGECLPFSKQCVSGPNGEPLSQACDSQGQWIKPGALCPFDCSVGECAGECLPGMQKCEGPNVLRCNSFFKWELDKDCASQGLTCIAVDAQGRSCGQCNPGGQAASCYFTQSVTCSADGFWKSEGDCADGGPDTVCVGKGECRRFGDICTNYPTAGGCLDESKGWACDSIGGSETVFECNCAEGTVCH